MVLAMLAIPMAASAGPVSVWTKNGNVWNRVDDIVGDGALVRCEANTPVGGSDLLNQEVHQVQISNIATIAQWIAYRFTNTAWNWSVRRPGTYAADCIGASVQSNDDLKIEFSGFGKLTGSEEGAQPIAVEYGYYGPPQHCDIQEPNTPLVPPPNDENYWFTPEELNAISGSNALTLPYSMVKSNDNSQYTMWNSGARFKLWNRIHVPRDQRACTYTGGGTITIKLVDIKEFIDGETGRFKADLPPPEV